MNTKQEIEESLSTARQMHTVNNHLVTMNIAAIQAVKDATVVDNAELVRLNALQQELVDTRDTIEGEITLLEEILTSSSFTPLVASAVSPHPFRRFKNLMNKLMRLGSLIPSA